MAVPPDIKLGPRSQVVAQGARWDDEYPAWQAYADELENLCGFLKEADQFSRFLPRLQARKKERNSALNEVRVAFHLRTSGFPVANWEPFGRGRTTGEFLVGSGERPQIFAEVKGPTWEAELSQGERLSGRTREPKYLNGEGRAFDNSEWIRFAVDKAYPKFRIDWPNLLVIADDLFVSLRHGTEMFAAEALYEARPGGCFANSRYERLGGVGVFWDDNVDSRIHYTFLLYLNSNALESCRLPDQFIKVFNGRTL